MLMEKSNNHLEIENKIIPYDKEPLCYDPIIVEWILNQGDTPSPMSFDSLKKIYESNILDRNYFLGCPIDIYKETYKSRLSDFQNRIKDSKENDFIDYELNKKNEILSEYYKTINFKNTHIDLSIKVAVNLRNEYFKERTKELGYKIYRNAESGIYTIEPLQIVETKPLSKLEKQEEKQNSIHPKHDPNLWDKEAYELFKYLYDNYYLDGRQSKVKLSSIWLFLNDYKHLDKIKKPKYNLHATKDNYKIFINNNYSIKITNMDKKNSYHTLHYPIINDHLDKFEKDLFNLQNT